jgi:hypothetical protein
MSEPVKLFTVEKANRALPLVRRVMDDLLREHPRWRDLVARYEVAAANARADWGESAEQAALRRQIDEVAVRINGFLDELSQIGCQLKGFEPGLVDFFGRYQGRIVCLCWKHGEASVSHWHEVDAGFAGRQEITPQFEATLAEAGV